MFEGSNWHQVIIDPYSDGSQTGAILFVLALLAVVVASVLVFLVYWGRER